MSRQSTYPNSDQTASLLAQQRLKDKQREYTAFLTIHQQSTKLRAVFEQFNNKMEILGDGSSTIATVVEHWQTVFRATHLALASLDQKKVRVSEDEDRLEVPENAKPDLLIRIPTNRE